MAGLPSAGTIPAMSIPIRAASAATFASTVASTLLLITLGGCNSTRTEQFDVTVHNQTPHPLTLSLAKDGPPYEAVWAAPEDIAIESPKLREQWRQTAGGMTGLPPGRTVDLKKLTGRFDQDTHGYLRAYAGDLTISQMLSMSRGSPDRVDVQLVPGFNEITIVLEGTHLKAQVNQPAPR